MGGQVKTHRVRGRRSYVYTLRSQAIYYGGWRDVRCRHRNVPSTDSGLCNGGGNQKRPIISNWAFLFTIDRFGAYDSILLNVCFTPLRMISIGFVTTRVLRFASYRGNGHRSRARCANHPFAQKSYEHEYHFTRPANVERDNFRPSYIPSRSRATSSRLIQMLFSYIVALKAICTRQGKSQNGKSLFVPSGPL
jgi:hypothetical protein